MFDFRQLSKETKEKIIQRYRNQNQAIPKNIEEQLKAETESAESKKTKIRLF